MHYMRGLKNSTSQYHVININISFIKINTVRVLAKRKRKKIFPKALNLPFAQACRGENVDKGVRLQRPMGMRVQTDSLPVERDYAIPLHADMLMMWASYIGM